MEILIPIIILGGLGLGFGLVLAIASKKFCVEADPRIEKIFSRLPGANCGACGFPGCMGFAEGLIQGSCTVEKCTVSNEEAKEGIAKILGVKIKEEVKKVATLHCFGGSRAKDKYTYQGIKDCVAANLVLGGQKACVYGCLGFGDCLRVCPFDAIKMSEDGLPLIDKDKCKACNKCVEICPKKILSLSPLSGNVFVACSSHDLGKDTKASCPVGCIACKLCEKACPVSAIKVIDNVAVIDYDKCTSCGKCIDVCPMKTIRKRG